MHFTYSPAEGESLSQGDILVKDAAVLKVLEVVHPHYRQKEDYTHFMVLTQSCDLLRRDGEPCKSRYVSLAAVRPLRVLIEREVERFQPDTFSKVGQLCSDRSRTRLEDVVRKLLNNNLSEYFYLEAEPTNRLPEACCAFLRLSIAVRAYEHYGTLLNARALSLSKVFQAKLGWLVGNMYSRVGTEDWAPDHIPRSDFEDKIRVILEEAVQWVDERQLKTARDRFEKDRASDPDLQLDRGMARQYVGNSKPPKKKDLVIDEVLKALRKGGFIDEENEKTVRTLLTNHPGLAAVTK